MYPMGQAGPPPQGGVYGQPQQGWGQPPQQFGQPQSINGQYGMINRYQQPPQPSATYGNYTQPFFKNVFEINAWQAMQFNSQQSLEQMFNAHASPRNGGLQGEGLWKILNSNDNIKNYYQNRQGPVSWSLELCKVMIAMLDRNKDGFMGYNEFNELLQCLIYWFQTFCQKDVNRDGCIQASELTTVINNMFGYKVSQQTLTTLLKRYATVTENGVCIIGFSDFVSLSVRLRAYTEAFRARDQMANGGHETGHCNFAYDDFLQCTMCL